MVAALLSIRAAFWEERNGGGKEWEEAHLPGLLKTFAFLGATYTFWPAKFSLDFLTWTNVWRVAGSRGWWRVGAGTQPCPIEIPSNSLDACFPYGNPTLNGASAQCASLRKITSGSQNY